MSVYTGRQGPGAARLHRAVKRDEASLRQERHDHRVLRYAIANGVSEVEARKMLRLTSHLARQILAGRVL